MNNLIHKLQNRATIIIKSSDMVFLRRGMFVLFLIFLGYVNAWSQTEKSDFIKISNPEVSSFLKFVDYPVDDFSGSADISIPIYTINDGSAQIPITLRYNTSGIKVNEEASWVGLGWNLNVGGVICQTAVGEFDNIGLYNNANSYGLWPVYDSNIYSPLGRTSSLNSCFAYPANCLDAYTEYNTLVLEGKLMPDVYYFSFLNYSGKFYVDPTDQTIHQVQKDSNIKFSELSEGGWKAVTEDGTVFTFTTPLQIYQNGDLGDIVSSSYYLDCITYPNGQIVTFTYTAENYYSQPSYSSLYRIAEGQNVSNFNSGSSPNGLHVDDVFIMENVLCSSIETDNIKLDFKVSSRGDLNGTAMKLDTICVSDKQNTSRKRKFVFSYDYFVTPTPYGTYAGNTSGNSNFYARRLRLNSFGEYGIGANYRFSYNSTQLPVKTSFAQDYWGYYNGKISNNTLIPNYNYMDIADEFPISDETKSSGADRTYNFAYCRACILDSIVYPTGGKVKYTYEPNTFSGYFLPTSSEANDIFVNGQASSYSGRTYSYGAGLRVKAITAYNNDNSISQKKIFTYDSISSGKVFGELNTPLTFYKEYENVKYEYCSSTPSEFTIFYEDETDLTGSNQYSYPYSIPRGNVGYSKVYEENINYSNPNSKENGFVVKYFKTLSKTGRDYDLVKGIPRFHNPMLGLLEKVQYINQSGTVKREEIYTYEDTLLSVGRGAYAYSRYNRLSERYENNNLVACLSDMQETQKFNSFTTEFFAFYAIPSFGVHLKEKTVNEESISSTETYKYNGYGQLSSKISTNSDGSVYGDYFTYVSDYTGTSTTIDSMHTNNWLGLVLHKEQRVNGTVVYQEDNHYKQWLLTGLFYINGKDVYPTGSTTAKQTYKYGYQTSSGIINRNMVQYESDMPESYYWAYNMAMPVIKAKSLTNSALTSLVTQSLSGTGYSTLDALLSAITSYPNTAWNTFNQNLRNNAFGALITTYSYNPLFGITSETAPNGTTTYYIYDSFGRLKEVKDDDGKLLKKYTYNYATN